LGFLVTKAVFLTFLAALCLAAPAQAAKPIVGFGEQSPNMFRDARWAALDKPYTRYVMPWDGLRFKKSRAQIDYYMAVAKAHRAA